MNKKTMISIQLNAVCACILMLFPVGSSAQLLEEVTVTAQKREQNLQDVGVSVTAFSGDQLSALGYTSTIDVAQQTPAMLVLANHPAVTNVNIRGVSQNDFGYHLEAPIALYVDDAYISSMGVVQAQMFDLDRVEVLRGPQGTLFGRNATGGLMHYISRRPTESFEGYGEFTYADYDQVKFEGAVSGPITGRLLGRLSIATHKHDGIVENRIGKDVQDADNYSARGQLLFRLTADLDVHLKAAYSVDDSAGWAGTHTPSTFNAQGFGEPIAPDQTGIFFGIADLLGDATQNDPIMGPCPGCDPFGYAEPDDDPFTGSFDFQPEFERDVYNYQAKITGEVKGIAVTSITDFLRVDKEDTKDIDGTPLNQVTFASHEDRKQFSQELRLSGETERTTWTAGVYYLDFDTETSAVGYEDIGPLVTFGFDSSTGAVAPAFNDPSMPCFAPPFSGPCPPGLPGFQTTYSHRESVDSESWAIFGHLEYNLSDTITLIGALRYTEDEREMDIVIDNLAFGAPLFDLNPDNLPILKQTYENVSAKAQINYTPTNDWLLYASFTRGHKAGNFNAPFFAPMDLNTLHHDEEVLHSFEVGAKGALMDNRIRVNASAFYYDYSDYQASFFINFGQVLANLDAEAYGAELELSMNPIDGLDLLFGVSLIESTVKDVGLPNGTTGDRELPVAPPVSVNGLARYTWPAFGGNLAVQGDFYYVDGYCYSVICQPTEDGESYVVGNARVSYTTGDEKWEVAVFVRNLADKEYVVYKVDSSFAGFSARTFGNPRWFGATVTYRWD